MPRVLCCLLPLITLASVSHADDFPKLFNTQEETERLLAPEEALSKITVPEGFKVTLFAAEPAVQQPIAITTDERGRLWVAENYTYAESATNFETKLKDRIVILEDTNGDGKHDQRTVFWDQASKLTSIEIGFGGVWALCAPDLLFIPDRNRDDVPDGKPTVVLTGWDDDKVRHNMVNGLRWGPDGWLYGRHGIMATSLVGAPETAPEHRTPIDCAIWRYHPTRKTFEVVCSGTTNAWGMDWDEHGQMFFINTVIGHLWHVIPGAYYQRMYGEHLDSHVYRLLPQTADHYHWDTNEAWHDTKKIGVTPTTDAAGGGHAHCGMMIYQGSNWPTKYRGKLFTCNLHGLRINCDRIERTGATYVGKHEPDFFRTTDRWFRGIELCYGADGGVYVADWSDIGECHENDGVHRTSGRIFKVVHGQVKRGRARQRDMSTFSSEDLVLLQAHDNEWNVRHARRLLQERFESGVEMKPIHDRLLKMFESEQAVMTKLRAMWALYVTSGTSESWLREQLQHENEHVRLWAIQLLVDQGTISEATRDALDALARVEKSGLVLTFLGSSLRRHEHADRWSLATELAQKPAFADDPVYPLMVWYGIEPAVTEHPDQALRVLSSSNLPIVREHITRRLTGEIERQPETVNRLTALLAAPDEGTYRLEILRGMESALKGWRKAKAPTRWANIQRRLARSNNEDVRRIARELSIVFGDGRALDELREVAKKGGEIDARRSAIQTLVAARDKAIVPLLQDLVGNRDFAVDAIRGLAAFDDPTTPKLIVEKYSSHRREPARQASIATLTSRADYARHLITAVESGQIAASAVTPFQLRQLQLLGDAQINRDIDRLWPKLRQLSTEKRERIEQYRKRLTPEVLARAELSAGRATYNQHCGKCHQLFGQGAKIGPDLTGAQRHDLNYLLENILDPSATVSKNFHVSIALMDDGRVIIGIVVGENERTITMQTQSERLTLLRDEIEELRPSKLSMMPEKQLEFMSPTQVRDLIGYLMSPSQVPLPNESAAN